VGPINNTLTFFLRDRRLRNLHRPSSICFTAVRASPASGLSDLVLYSTSFFFPFLFFNPRWCIKSLRNALNTSPCHTIQLQRWAVNISPLITDVQCIAAWPELDVAYQTLRRRLPRSGNGCSRVKRSISRLRPHPCPLRFLRTSATLCSSRRRMKVC
jgi:hypothetical protein